MDQQSPFPTPPSHPYGEQPTPAPEHPHRRTRVRVAAVVASTALVAGVVGAGAGYVAGHGFGGGTSTTASGPQSSTNNSGTSGGSDGLQAIPGNPGWRWQGGGQSDVPTDPYGNGGDQGGWLDPVRHHQGVRVPADRPGADRLDHEVRRRQGGRHRHGADLRRRGGHQPPRRRGRHLGQGQGDEHRQDLHRGRRRHRRQGRRRRAAARRRLRAEDRHHRHRRRRRSATRSPRSATATAP